MKKLILIPLLFICLYLKAQVTFDSIYHELKRQEIKYPELFTALAITESGLGTYDEDIFLISINNFWLLEYEKKCNCINKEGFCSYKDLTTAIKDLKKRFAPTLKKVHSEEQMIKYLCMYYVGVSPQSFKGELWVRKLITIYNDSFFE
jgi:hypothetical protein